MDERQIGMILYANRCFWQFLPVISSASVTPSSSSAQFALLKGALHKFTTFLTYLVIRGLTHCTNGYRAHLQ